MSHHKTTKDARFKSQKMHDYKFCNLDHNDEKMET